MDQFEYRALRLAGQQQHFQLAVLPQSLRQHEHIRIQELPMTQAEFFEVHNDSQHSRKRGESAFVGTIPESQSSEAGVAL